MLYSYRDGPMDSPDNRALRAAAAEGVPLMYFWGIARGNTNQSFQSLRSATTQVPAPCSSPGGQRSSISNTFVSLGPETSEPGAYAR